MSRIVRRVVAVLLGTAVAVLVVVLFDLLDGRLFPLPTASAVGDFETTGSGVAAMPLAALLLLLGGWGLAAATGAFVAVRLTPERRVAGGMMVAALLLIAALVHFMALPHPGWMWPAAILVLPLFGWLGARAGVGLRRRSSPFARHAWGG